METIHNILQESISGGIFTFAGYWIIIYTILVIPSRVITTIINRFLRHGNIRKHGYPPVHCDADGNFTNTHF